MTDDLSDVDPFDLPEWLGEGDVTWESDRGLRSSHVVPGMLLGEEQHLVCDLLAVDEAFPQPVVPDDVRTRSHRAWHHGEMLLLEREGRLALAVPARRFDADLVLEAMARLAKAVGASADHYAVLLRIGRDRR